MKFYMLETRRKDETYFHWVRTEGGENAKVGTVKSALKYRRAGDEVRILEYEDITSFLDTL